MALPDVEFSSASDPARPLPGAPSSLAPRWRQAALVAILALLTALWHLPVVLGRGSWDSPFYQAQVVPARLAVAELVAQGSAPHWWDGAGLGAPLSTEPAHAAWYPATWLARSGWAVDLWGLLHLAGLALGLVGLTRAELRARGVALSGKAAVSIGALPIVLGVGSGALVAGQLASLTWAVLAIYLAQALARQRASASAALAMALALALAAGFVAGAPALALVAVALVVLEVLALAPSRLRWVALSLAVALALAAAAVLPFALAEPRHAADGELVAASWMRVHSGAAALATLALVTLAVAGRVWRWGGAALGLFALAALGHEGMMPAVGGVSLSPTALEAAASVLLFAAAAVGAARRDRGASAGPRRARSAASSSARRAARRRAGGGVLDARSLGGSGAGDAGAGDAGGGGAGVALGRGRAGAVRAGRARPRGHDAGGRRGVAFAHRAPTDRR
ncbi:MAG TPA: hypothetical protein PKU97_12405 [Kofleriaceae bacterium]|nr:hypothetical protein [Kofleriaceae bacterium]